MTAPPLKGYTVWRGISDGSIGGFAGGIAMIPFLLLPGIIMGADPLTMFSAFGLLAGVGTGSAASVGFLLHMATAVLIGIIFGAITAKTRRLKITSFAKGTVEGIIAGLIAFAVLSIPLGIFVLPQYIAQAIMLNNPIISTQEAVRMLEQTMPLTITLGIIEHLVFGAVLGIVTAAFALKFRPLREPPGDLLSRIGTKQEDYVCSSCQKRFASSQEMENHIRSLHHGAAA